LNKLKQGAPTEKLQQLLEIRDKRLNHAHDSPFQMQSACDLIPSTLLEDLDCVGYHRHCYQRFTSNLDRLDKKFEASSETHQQKRSKSSRSSTTDFGLEAETAFAKALDDVSTYLTPQIVKG